jgi:transposase
MLLTPTSLKVFALRGATDMRKSFSGLVGLIETQLGQQVESGHLFLFFNRRRDRVKVLYFVGDGLVIVYKRLEKGTFEAPACVASAPSDAAAGVELRWSELALILEGIELSSVQRRRRWRREPQPV